MQHTSKSVLARAGVQTFTKEIFLVTRGHSDVIRCVEAEQSSTWPRGPSSSTSGLSLGSYFERWPSSWVSSAEPFFHKLLDLTVCQPLVSAFRLFDALPIDANPMFQNEDLVGFFTSIPATRILSSVEQAVQKYHALHNLHDQSVFTVNLRESKLACEPFVARHERLPVKNADYCLKMWRHNAGFRYMLPYFPTLTEFFSTALAALTVSVLEEQWASRTAGFLETHRPYLFITRYVDNLDVYDFRPIDSAGTNLTNTQGHVPHVNRSHILLPDTFRLVQLYASRGYDVQLLHSI